MDRIAFYAPLKSPDHPVPSGDRELALGIQAALIRNNLGLGVELVSQLRCYDARGDSNVQQQLILDANQEIDRILSDPQARSYQSWVTYHNYYKAPDLIGPTVCEQLNIPYILIEASIATVRRQGPWAEFARRSDSACASATLILYLTERDRVALIDHQQPEQKILHFPPFLILDKLPDLKPAGDRAAQPEILSVGMLRGGDKFNSYEIIADVLPRLKTRDWRLSIVGDGSAKEEIETLFTKFGESVIFRGRLEREQVDDAYQRAQVFLWPGVNEAFGMVYLEAQAMGVPVVAQDRVGVRDVIAPANTLVPVNDHALLAQQVDTVLESAKLRQTMGDAGRAFVRDSHLLTSAAEKLSEHLRSVLPK